MAASSSRANVSRQPKTNEWFAGDDEFGFEDPAITAETDLAFARFMAGDNPHIRTDEVPVVDWSTPPPEETRSRWRRKPKPADAAPDQTPDPYEPLSASGPQMSNEPPTGHRPPVTREAPVGYDPQRSNEPPRRYEPQAMREPQMRYDTQVTCEPQMGYNTQVTREPQMGYDNPTQPLVRPHSPPPSSGFEHDDQEWRELEPAAAPPARGRSQMRYKVGLAVLAALVLFGLTMTTSPFDFSGTGNDTLAEDGEPLSADGEVSQSAGSDGTLITDGTVVAQSADGQLSAFGADGRVGESQFLESLGPAGDTISSSDYQSNLALIQSASVRNRNHDNSPYRNTPSDQLVLEDHFGPRSDYLGNPGDNPEQSFPTVKGGQYRAACEFSHFSYDDPLIYPGKPGASHLHMYFGNTDVNAFSTYDSLINTGSSTCNGQELNRTGYWVPAMFDSNGNVRVPERIVVYYKGEGRSRGLSEVYPEGAAMIAFDDLNTIKPGQGGAKGKFSFVCSDNFSGANSPASNTMPNCDGSRFKKKYGVDDNPRVVLEMNVKFPQCWNGKDPSNPDNFRIPAGAWYGSWCEGEFNRNLPNLEYFVNYPVEIGEDTSGWYLSSDVDPTDYGAGKAAAGSSIHGDWWGGWNKQVNQMFIDNCVNYSNPSGAKSGCGFGYLSDGGPDKRAPHDGPALKYRPQYEGPHKVPASQVFAELCPQPDHSYSRPEDAAYCAPGTGY